VSDIATARENTVLRHTVESLTDEIGRIVAERQSLRANGARPEDLEANRRRLTAAQAHLSQLLIERYLRRSSAA